LELAMAATHKPTDSKFTKLLCRPLILDWFDPANPAMSALTGNGE
jgi:hypothetical protein